MKDHTRAQIFFEAMCIVMLVGITVFFVVKYPQLPQIVPSHYNLAGQPDAWDTKSLNIGVLVIAYVIYIGICVVEIIPNIWNVPVKITDQNRSYVYRQMRWLMILAKLEVVGMFCYILFCDLTQRTLAALFVPVAIGAITASIVLITYKIVRYAQRVEHEQ